MQQWLLTHKTQIIKVWYALLLSWFIFFLVSVPLLSFPAWAWLGRQSATISIVVFWITLLPGILKRFQIAGAFLPARTLLMLYRRQLGITMYVFAFTHLMWSRFVPILSFGGNIWRLSPFELMGVLAFLLLTPVFITSNEWSVRNLGHAWRIIHSLVYVVVWLLFLHIAMQAVGWRGFGTLVIAALELFSLIWDKVRHRPAPQSVQ